MIPIVTPTEMAAIDRAAPESLEVLIERAAGQVAWAARSMLGGVYGRRVSVIAGPGNNGAEARLAAIKLERLGVRVRLVCARRRFGATRRPGDRRRLRNRHEPTICSTSGVARRASARC